MDDLRTAILKGLKLKQVYRLIDNAASPTKHDSSSASPAALPLPPSLTLFAVPWRRVRQLSTFNLQLPAAMRLIQLGSLISALLADKLPLFCSAVLLFCFDVRYFLSRTVANEKHSTLSQSNQIRGKYGRPAREASAKQLKLKSLLSISTWRATHLPDWCNKLALTGVSLSMRIIWISNYS